MNLVEEFKLNYSDVNGSDTGWYDMQSWFMKNADRIEKALEAGNTMYESYMETNNEFCISGAIEWSEAIK